MRRLLPLALFTIFGLITFAGPTEAATPPPSFVGTQLETWPEPDNGGYYFDCNPDGSGTVTWRLTGRARGTYEGVFEDVGSLTFGPTGSGAAVGYPAESLITSYQSSFTLQSQYGVVLGDTRLDPANVHYAPKGVCSEDLFGTGQWLQMRYANDLLWDITITTVDSVYAQSGAGTAAGYAMVGYSTKEHVMNFMSSSTSAPVFVAALTPTSKDQCVSGGYQQFGIFKNQGDCIAFVATGGLHGGTTPP